MGKASTPQENKVKSPVDLSQLLEVSQISGDSKKDTRLLREMADEAHGYLLSFKWCKRIRRSWFGWGVGGVCAVFFFEIQPSSAKIDRWLWVIIGDLPPAYLVTDASPSPLAALKNYTDLMEEWVETVKEGGNIEGCIPVNAPPTLEYASLLERRLRFIRKEFLVSSSRSKNHRKGRKARMQKTKKKRTA
jgi:hypothetical protein